MEVHGVLWLINEIHSNDLASTSTLLAVLRSFVADPTVRLPKKEVIVQIRRYEKGS